MLILIEQYLVSLILYSISISGSFLSPPQRFFLGRQACNSNNMRKFLRGGEQLVSTIRILERYKRHLSTSTVWPRVMIIVQLKSADLIIFKESCGSRITGMESRLRGCTTLTQVECNPPTVARRRTQPAWRRIGWCPPDDT